MLNPEYLATLLREAANDHHTYEATLGHSDADWPTWYADHIVKTLQRDSSAGVFNSVEGHRERLATIRRAVQNTKARNEANDRIRDAAHKRGHSDKHDK